MSPLIAQLHNRIIGDNRDLYWIIPNMIFLHVGGSRLYGTNGPTSDWDIRGVTIAPRDYWVGARKFQSTEFKIQIDGAETDVVIYDIRRFMELSVVHCNPNIIETLYVTPSAISGVNPLHTTDQWIYYRRRIQSMISQKAHVSFEGYASSQIKKLLAKQANKSGRQDLVEKFGYDTKFMAHAFRLVRQGKRLLETGLIQFPHPDAQWLRDIRDGKVFASEQHAIDSWKLEKQAMDEAVVHSPLPPTYDFSSYNHLLMEVFDRECRRSTQP